MPQVFRFVSIARFRLWVVSSFIIHCSEPQAVSFSSHKKRNAMNSVLSRSIGSKRSSYGWQWLPLLLLLVSSLLSSRCVVGDEDPFLDEVLDEVLDEEETAAATVADVTPTVDSSDINTNTNTNMNASSSSLPAMAVQEYTSRTLKSCIAEGLERRLHDPRHLIFGDIDMVVGFTVIPQSAEIEFTLLVPTHGWIGFGVSEVGSMVGADMVVVEPQHTEAAAKDDGSTSTTFRMTDRYSKGFVEPTVDKIQSWELLEASHDTITMEGCVENLSLTKAVVRRMLDTCDGEDLPLTPEYLQNYFVAAYGDDTQPTLGYHAKRASIAEYVHVPAPMIPKSPKGDPYDLLTPPMDVPAGVTNYCYAKMTVDQPLLVTAYTAVNIRNVHHIGLFQAAAGSLSGLEGVDYACTSNFNGMGTPQLQWAIGTKEIVLPSGLYIRLEPGEYYYEVHFENLFAEAFSTVAGLRAYALTDDARVNPEDEIQILNLESRFADPIPAGQERAEKGFVLPSECLDGLPPSGVTMMYVFCRCVESSRHQFIVIHW